jgi:hypothetical protein
MIKRSFILKLSPLALCISLAAGCSSLIRTEFFAPEVAFLANSYNQISAQATLYQALGGSDVVDLLTLDE